LKTYAISSYYSPAVKINTTNHPKGHPAPMSRKKISKRSTRPCQVKTKAPQSSSAATVTPLASPLQLLARSRSVLEKHLPASLPNEKLCMFVSYTDAATRAQVFHLTGTDLDTLWAQLLNELKRRTRTNCKNIAWLRLDWVNHIEAHTWAELNEILAATKRNYFRRGISLDPEFKYPFLEQELNANAMLYPGPGGQGAQLNPKNFSAYARQRFKPAPELKISPHGQVYTFTTGALFVSADKAPLVLNCGNSAAGYNSGRRKVDLNQENLSSIIDTSARYLAAQVKPNGYYVYGMHPCFNREINTYNTLRHASSTYALLEAWEILHEPGIKSAVDRALEVLTRSMIKDYPLPDGTTAAFLLDLNNEIKLGGNAVAILALTKYTELTADKQYLPLLERLATGILFMQDKTTGTFTHVLNSSDLSTKEQFRIIYYEGEAAFGLMRLYALTRDSRWLQCVEKAFEHFIAARHWQHHDHWLSYCVNELTLYRPERRYYQFGLNNVSGYLNFVLERITTFPTLLELMMAAHKMIQRLRHDPDHSDLLRHLDLEKFYRALEYRAHYMLNGHFWPELAMYFKNPRRILGSFFIRHHGFRIRIDDVEHYLSGYIAYLNHYLKQHDALLAAQPQVGLSNIPAPAPPARAILNFGGDANLGRRQHYRTRQLGSSNILNIPELSQGDVNMLNLECVVSTLGKQGIDKGEGGPYYYRAHPQMLEILLSAGINCVFTANNHSGDYGPAALMQQRQILSSLGIAVAGSGETTATAFRPVLINTRGLRIAVFSFDTTQSEFSATTNSPGNAWIPLSQVEKWQQQVCGLIRAASSRADLVFVAIHWGKNHTREPSELHRKAARILIDAGAHAILGTSAHAVHGVEVYKKAPIIYDAGDLLFDSERSHYAPGGLFQLGLSAKGVDWVRYIPVGIGFGFSQRLYAAEAQDSLHNFIHKCRALGTCPEVVADACIIPIDKSTDLEPKASQVAFHSNKSISAGFSQKITPFQPDKHHGVATTVPQDAVIEPVSFKNGLILLGVRIHPTYIDKRRPLWVETWWKSEKPLMYDLRLDIQARSEIPNLMPPWGHGMDHDPCDWMRPTTTWEPHTIYCDFYALRPPPRAHLRNGVIKVHINVIGPQRNAEAYIHPHPITVQLTPPSKLKHPLQEKTPPP
jgi:hypothetical protein